MSNQQEEALGMLTAMGFPDDQARAALRECGGNLENAANLLLSGGGGSAAGTTTSSSNDTNTAMIHGALHQYNVDNGKSACTCIALTAAEQFLKQQQQQQPAVDAKFLQNAVLQGVEKYNALMAGGSSSTEHLSAEEVLQTGAFPSLQLDAGGVMQGMLSPRNGPLSLQALLSASQMSQWTCVLIIKPPETVLCCLPPANSSNSSATLPFLLIDSHPRPQQFDAQGSYVRQHGTLAALVQSLETLFPATQLGPDVPEWMGAMYNQFDLYRLRLA